jgi:hypothetical protein
MCYVQIIMAVVAVVAAVAQDKAQNKAMKRQEDALNEQNKQRSQEIEDAASADMNERARAVRRARASARATASEAGINLSSGSFLAQLNSFNAQQDMQSGLVTKNKQNAQLARQAEYHSGLARISYKNGLGIALDGFAAGASAYSGSGGKMYMGNNPGAG